MKVLFIQTGGTIDKDYPISGGSYAFTINAPAYKQVINNLPFGIDYISIEMFQKDSSDITNEDRQKLLLACKRTKEEKIIITHGTDSMLETAKTLSEIKYKTIVITGSFLPYKFISSDASFNIGVAFAAVNFLEPGIYISINGKTSSWGNLIKDVNSGEFIDNN